MPVQGGKLTILDPAGKYLTSSNSHITSNTAASELEKYNDYWSSNGEIKNIELYWIDVLNGNYNIVASGNLNTISNFLANR